MKRKRIWLEGVGEERVAILRRRLLKKNVHLMRRRPVYNFWTQSRRALMFKFRLMLIPAVLGSFVCACADTFLSYSNSGTFSASTPSDAFGFSGPSDKWSFSFKADSNPAPLSDVGMGGFDFPFSDFSYSLNGSPVAITPTFIRFFSGTNGGGWEICFNGASNATCTEGLATDGPQMYTGTTSAPTLIAGAFTSTGVGASVGSTGFPFSQPNNTMQAAAVPEPSTALLTLTALGLLVLGGRRLYWHTLRRSCPALDDGNSLDLNQELGQKQAANHHES